MRILASAAVLWLYPLFACGPRQAPPSKLNLVLITVDTLRADRVGFYSGQHLRTPNMDRLAAAGAVFTRAFSHCTTTLPAHADILLGATPLSHGVHDNANFVVREEFLTLAEHLKNSGYSTGAFIGGFPLESRFGLAQGFDTYDDRLERTGETPGDSWTRRAEAVVASALAWLEGREPPWFLWIHLWDPHEPYSPPEPYRSRFRDRLYDGEVAYADAALGPLFEHLGRTGLDRKSLLLLTGDHGESLGEHGEATHGFLAYNATLWIPLIIAMPAWDHRTVETPVSHVDIFPTICELLGVAMPPHLQGASLARAMREGGGDGRPIYFESLTPYYSMDWAPVRGFIDQGEKFIDSPLPEIFDLGNDFAEVSNLARAKDVAARKIKLAGLVRGLSSETEEEAARASDRRTIERLRSLGYLAASPGPGGAGRKDFGPDDDVKSLLPFYNRAIKALSLYEAGETDAAVAEAGAVISARKNISTAYLNLAHFYKEQDRRKEAAAVLKQGLAALPSNYYIYLEYLTCLYEMSEFDAAIDVFEKSRPRQVEFDPMPWNYAGLSRLKKGDAPGARQCFEKALAIDGDFSISWYNLGNLDYDLFQKTGDRTKLEAAAASLRKAADLDPTSGPARYVLGVALYQMEDFPGAVASLEEALALDSGIDDALYYLGMALFRSGDAAGACSRLKEYRVTDHYRGLSAEEKEAVDGLLSRFCPAGSPR